MDKPFLTFAELVNYTGFAKSYLYKLTMQGKVPGASKPGGKKLFFDKQKIDLWLLGSPVIINKGMTNDEKEIAASTYVATGSLILELPKDEYDKILKNEYDKLDALEAAFKP